MTKRRIKTAGPAGFNKSLGNQLVNQGKAKRIYVQPNVARTASPEKVLDSVTHESNLEEFLTNADLANRDFTAERGNFQILSTNDATVVNPDDLVSQSFNELNEKYGELLKIPRRPSRDSYNNAEELSQLENEMFLDWRRNVSLMQESCGVVMTPFERNLELWRQLWRVVERSDLVVQIVDARNPLIFRNADLEAYVKEVNPIKANLLLINKSDLLAPEHIERWREYFQKEGVHVVFSSAKSESTGAELIECFKKYAFMANRDAEKVVVGLIGYPNVGKSSTINTIYGQKKTSVSATPGKTKHFQTLIIDDELTLCDCPGLVMPSFGFNSSEMILNAILPVDRMRDYYSPTQLLCNRVPRAYLEALYSVMLPKPADHEDPKRPPTAHELLTTVAFMKGFMSSAGIPDCSRAARVILKDVVSGKLRLIAAPPGVDQEEFDRITFSTLPEKKQATKSENLILEQLEKRNLLVGEGSGGRRLDNTFFNRNEGAAHVVGCRGGNASVDEDGRIRLKKGKKDKLRRVYRDLDA